MKFGSIASERVLFPLIFLAVIFWHIFSLTSYPMYFPDDGMMASRVQTMLESGDSRGTLEVAAYNEIPNSEKIFNKSGYYISSLPSLFAGKITLLTIRAANLFFIAIILILVFLISKKIADWRLGVLSVFLLGFSQCFAYGTHIARHDLISAAMGLSALALFLFNKKEKLSADVLTGVILVLGLLIHPRIIIYIPIIASLYLHRYGLKAFTSKNAWSYATGVVVSAALYYFVFVMPYQDLHTAFLKMTVGDSRSMPLLSLDYQQFYICLKEIFSLLDKESYLFLAVFLELLIGIVFFRKSQLTILLAATLFFTAGIMRNFYDFNAIIVLPLLCIGSAAFIDRFFAKKVFGVLAIILLLNFSYNSLSKMSRAISNGCNAELEANASEIAKIVSTQDVLIGVDSFWFSFQKNKFHSWVILNFLRRFHNWSLEQAFNFLKPDYMIADGRFFYFTRKTPGKSDWYNNFLINYEELDRVLKRYSKVVWKKENTCNGSLVLYKFNWSPDDASSNFSD